MQIFLFVEFTKKDFHFFIDNLNKKFPVIFLDIFIRSLEKYTIKKAFTGFIFLLNYIILLVKSLTLQFHSVVVGVISH